MDGASEAHHDDIITLLGDDIILPMGKDLGFGIDDDVLIQSMIDLAGSPD